MRIQGHYNEIKAIVKGIRLDNPKMSLRIRNDVDDIQLKVIGGTLVRRYPRQAEVLVSTWAGAREDLAVAAVKSAGLVYPEAVEKELGLGK